ncbi:MAG TPA: hypothetical protein DCW90_11855 [Lachnospiraceae bacterium]|nr:hypothetical protein [Lachnospiraceae bacterium]
METIYGNIPNEQIERQKKYFYGAIINLLYQREVAYPFLDNRIQTLINQISGMNKLFDYQPEILTIVSCLENARTNDDQFRKSVLDAANLVNELKYGGE